MPFHLSQFLRERFHTHSVFYLTKNNFHLMNVYDVRQVKKPAVKSLSHSSDRATPKPTTLKRRSRKQILSDVDFRPEGKETVDSGENQAEKEIAMQTLSATTTEFKAAEILLKVKHMYTPSLLPSPCLLPPPLP